MKLRNFKSAKTLGAAIAAAALMSGAGSALASPVSLTLQFECPLPLIGVQPIRAEISADVPTQATVGDPTPEFTVNALTVVNEDSRTGLKLVGSQTIEGTATNQTTVITQGRSFDLTVPLTIPPSPIPSESGEFTVPASGTSPSITFTEADIGEAQITVGGLVLHMIARTANGEVAPMPIGDFTADCTQVAGQNNVLQTVQVVGTTVEAPRIAVNNEALEFGNVQAGLNEVRTVTISNTGNAALGINNISISGADASAFMQTNACGTIAPSASCDVDVTYIPSGEGAQTANLAIDSTDPEAATVNVALSGRSVLAPVPEIAVNPQSVSLGRVQIGESTSAQVTVSNNGTETLLIDSVSLAGADASAFLQTNNCTTVAKGQSCTVDLSFTATAAGTFNAQLVIGSDDPENPEISVPVSAEGFDQPTDTLELLLGLTGSTTINSSNSTLPLNGTIATMLELASGTFEADLAIDPTVGNFSVRVLFAKLKAVANVEFQQSEITTGTLVNGKLTANSKLYVKVPKVAMKLFGHRLQIGGGSECQTIEPVDITLTSPDGKNFSPASGGEVSGVYTLPPLHHCGLLTDILNIFMTGPNNTINLTLTPEL